MASTPLSKTISFVICVAITQVENLRQEMTRTSQRTTRRATKTEELF